MNRILGPFLGQKLSKKLTLDWSIFPLELQNLIYEYLIETELSLYECISQNMNYKSKSGMYYVLKSLPEGSYSLNIRNPYLASTSKAFISFTEYPSTCCGKQRGWTFYYSSTKEYYFFPLDSDFKDKNIQKKRRCDEEQHDFTLLEIFLNIKTYMDKYPQNSSRVILLNKFFKKLNLFYFCNNFFVSLK